MEAFRLTRAATDLRTGLRRSAAETAAIQLERLRKLVAFAYERVPYYRKLLDGAGFHPRDLRSASDLVAIPVSTREQLQSVPIEDRLVQGVSRDRLIGVRSSGSTGTPVTMYRSRLESRIGLLIRARTWKHYGIRPTDRVLTINGRPSTFRRRLWSTSAPLAGRWNLSLFEEPDAMLEALECVRPTVIYGYSYHVARLARSVTERRFKGRAPRLVATSGDALLPVFRTMIREAWGVEPFDIYNASELGDIAWQCARREAMHINADQVLVEFLRDGNAVPAGEPGEVVATNLYRYSMPLIRYSPGDLAAPVDGRCLCGVELPLMEALVGRTLDVVPLPGGGWYIGFIRILSNFPELSRYQVVQPALDRFEVNVVPGEGFSPAVIARIAAEVSSQFDGGISVEVRVVEEGELLRTPVKLRPVIPFHRVDFGNAPWQ
jgi:phenylacetate-CoA ligase